MSHKHRHERNELKDCVVDLDKREIRTKNKTFHWSVESDGSRRWHVSSEDLDSLVDDANHKKRAKDMSKLLKNAIHTIDDYTSRRTGQHSREMRLDEAYQFLLDLQDSRMLAAIDRVYCHETFRQRDPYRADR